MNYKGKEVKEANGPDYPLSNTTKKMLVWDDDCLSPIKMEVAGFFNGCWIARDVDSTGTSNWKHAAEIPTKEETLLTNRELAKWLAQGNGEISREDWQKTYITHSYLKKDEHEHVDDCLRIRKWDDEEWHRPTREYCFGEEDA